MKTGIILSVLLSCLILTIFISCATEPVIQSSTVDKKSVPTTETLPELFTYNDYTDLQIEIHSAIHEQPDIPSRVTYIMVDPSIIEETVDKVREFFILGSDPQSLFGEMVICGPYLTDHLSENKAFQALEYLPIIATWDQDNMAVEKGFRTSKSVSAFAHYLRNTLNNERGFLIRKPTAVELDWYWTIIFYDIEEPVFVLESSSHRVFLDFIDDEIMFADDFIFLD